MPNLSIVVSPYKYVPITQAAEIPNKVGVEIVAILREAGAAIGGA